MFRYKRALGILTFSLGVGVMLVILVPAVGWLLFSALCLICMGMFLIRL